LLNGRIQQRLLMNNFAKELTKRSHNDTFYNNFLFF
jgi:hypothetical protein